MCIINLFHFFYLWLSNRVTKPSPALSTVVIRYRYIAKSAQARLGKLKPYTLSSELCYIKVKCSDDFCSCFYVMLCNAGFVKSIQVFLFGFRAGLGWWTTAAWHHVLQYVVYSVTLFVFFMVVIIAATSIQPNDEISAITDLPSISVTISSHCNALFGHVSRLPVNVPAHKARHPTAKSTYR